MGLVLPKATQRLENSPDSHFLKEGVAGSLIKLNSRQCLFHICCQSIQTHKGKSMNIFHLHS